MRLSQQGVALQPSSLPCSLCEPYSATETVSVRSTTVYFTESPLSNHAKGPEGRALLSRNFLSGAGPLRIRCDTRHGCDVPHAVRGLDPRDTRLGGVDGAPLAVTRVRSGRTAAVSAFSRRWAREAVPRGVRGRALAPGARAVSTVLGAHRRSFAARSRARRDAAPASPAWLTRSDDVADDSARSARLSYGRPLSSSAPYDLAARTPGRGRSVSPVNLLESV